MKKDEITQFSKQIESDILKEVKKVCKNLMLKMLSDCKKGVSLELNFKNCKIQLEKQYNNKEIVRTYLLEIAKMWLKLTNSYAIKPEQLLTALRIY